MAILENADVNIISWWGAGLSTLLALIKLIEVWRDRFRIDIGYSFCGDPVEGNKIYIRNLSGTPQLLEHWELFYRSTSWLSKKESFIASSDESSIDTRIESHSSVSLRFIGINHFDWSRKDSKRSRIYIRLHLAGHQPIVKKVFG